MNLRNILGYSTQQALLSVKDAPNVRTFFKSSTMGEVAYLRLYSWLPIFATVSMDPQPYASGRTPNRSS